MYSPVVSGRPRRKSLDELMYLVQQPSFAHIYRRLPLMCEAPGHASLRLLELAPPKSRYVRRWRRHARHCPSCAELFHFLGISLNS